MNFAGILIRFIVAVLVIRFLGGLHFGFRVAGFQGAFAAAFIIALLNFVVERVAGAGVSSLRWRRWIGFVTSAVVIYLTQFFIPQIFRVTVWGALLAAIFIGLADTFIPRLLK